MQNQKFFSNTLLDWNETENKRQMPWKGESNPYRIWISEIILQQTRVQQGMEYYNRFIAAFPEVSTTYIGSIYKQYHPTTTNQPPQ